MDNCGVCFQHTVISSYWIHYTVNKPPTDTQTVCTAPFNHLNLLFMLPAVIFTPLMQCSSQLWKNCTSGLESPDCFPWCLNTFNSISHFPNAFNRNQGFLDCISPCYLSVQKQLEFSLSVFPILTSIVSVPMCFIIQESFPQSIRYQHLNCAVSLLRHGAKVTPLF